MALCLLCSSLEEENRVAEEVVLFPLAFFGGGGKAEVPSKGSVEWGRLLAVVEHAKGWDRMASAILKRSDKQARQRQ